jgi:replicative DNA helicase
MSSSEIISRLIAMKCGVFPTPISRKKYSANEWTKVRRAIDEVHKLKFSFISFPSDWQAVEGAARKAKPDMLLVDYIQLVHLRNMRSNETREQLVSEVARRMKLLASTGNMTVITASQLNDDGKLRDSRAIGHHSDSVIEICSEEHEKPERSIAIVKNRRGPNGSEDFVFDKPIYRFSHIQKHQ